MVSIAKLLGRLFFVGMNLAGVIGYSAELPGEIDTLVQARQEVLLQLSELSAQRMNLAQSNLLEAIGAFKDSYAHIDRLTLDPEWLYNAQFQLRFLNYKLQSTLKELSKRGLLTREQKQKVEYEANILTDKDQPFYRSPKKSLPIEGIKGSDWPLSRWQSDRDFYNYTYEGNEVLYRGLRLRSGDVLLNHPIEKPVGIFSTIAEKRSVFSHGALIVFIRNKWGRLPVVVDVHERGIRAVPLHHYFGPKVLGYGEVFRIKDLPSDFEERVNSAVKVLMSEEHPYDLTGSEDRKALSCVEMISYVLELMGQPKFQLQNKVHNNIYANILKLGKLDYQRFQMPNDALLDPRMEYIGYIDNTQSLEVLVSNEVLLDLFRDKMIHKVMKEKKSLTRMFGEIAIAQMRSKHSLFGGFLLKAIGFNRDNFPEGDPALLTAVNAIDFTFVNAMNRCLGLDKIVRSGSCFKSFRQSVVDGLTTHDFSIHSWKADLALRKVANQELKEFERMFE